MNNFDVKVSVKIKNTTPCLTFILPNNNNKKLPVGGGEVLEVGGAGEVVLGAGSGLADTP
jgi:hypothetical protein